MINCPKYLGGVTVKGMQVVGVCLSESTSTAVIASRQMFQTTIIDSYVSNLLKGGKTDSSKLEVRDSGDKLISILEVIKPINEDTYLAAIEYKQRQLSFKLSSSVTKLEESKPGVQSFEAPDYK